MSPLIYIALFGVLIVCLYLSYHGYKSYRQFQNESGVDLMNPIHFLVFLFGKRDEQQQAAFDEYRQRQNRGSKIWGLTLLLLLIIILIIGLFDGKKTKPPKIKSTIASSYIEQPR